MKTKMVIILLIFFKTPLAAQTQANVTTPKGSTAVAWITPEFNHPDHPASYWRNYWDGVYSTFGGTYLYYLSDAYSSTNRFNCHGYAWHMSDGHPNELRWIGLSSATEEDVYKTDGSYLQVCYETYPGKVFFGSGGDEHSAVTTSTPGTWTSKWGWGPLVTHSKNSHPYDTTVVPYQYYISTRITGSTDSLCFNSSRTFSVTNATGVTYSWSYSSNLSPVGSTGTNQLVVEPNGTTAGAAWVQVQMSSSCAGSPITTTTNFSVGGTPFPQPGIISIDEYDLLLGRITVSLDPDEIPGATYNWYKNGVLQINAYHAYWAKIPVPTEECDYSFTVGVTAKNSCGVESAMQTESVYVPCDNFFLLSPNPSSQEVVVSVNKKMTARKGAKNKTFDEIRIYNLQGNLKKRIKYNKVNQARINLNGLQKGTYFVEIVNGRFAEKKQLFIQ